MTNLTFLNMFTTAPGLVSILFVISGIAAAESGSDRLVINEFMAENDSTIVDPDGSGGYPDWIELYNGGEASIDLGGMYLSDDLSWPTEWPVPEGVSIAPGEYLLFWADDDMEQGPTHMNFKLDRTGEEIGLFDTDANGNQMIDMIVFGPQTADISHGRYPDGADNWTAQRPPTPGSANSIYYCGDANGDAEINTGDAVYILSFVFKFGPAPEPLEAGDANGDRATNVGDAVYLINYILRNGLPPDCPQYGIKDDPGADITPIKPINLTKNNRRSIF